MSSPCEATLPTQANPITIDEYEAIKSMSNSTLRHQQLNDVIKRIGRCKKRLQLRFPSIFRNGILLQYLIKYIKANKNIIHFACGLNENHLSGFYALNEILKLKNITRFNLRISDLSLASTEFFDTLSNANLTQLYLKFDSCTNENFKLLCDALKKNKTLKKLTFSCKLLTTESIEYFAEYIAKATNINILSISFDNITLDQFTELCINGISHTSNINHLDIEDCFINYQGMKILCDTLKTNENIKTLTLGNNGYQAMTAFFEQLGDLKYIESLICNESQLVNTEKIDLNLISSSLNKLINNPDFNKLRVLQLPLFIFNDTNNKSLSLFVESLTNPNNKINILQLFPLFQHLDRAQFNRNPEFCDKISYFFHLLFDGLCNNKYLKKLYIEMIGSENNFFTKNVADSFLKFMLNSNVNELYLPFVCLIDLNKDILDNFINCKELISIKDDTFDYGWLEYENEPNKRRYKYTISAQKKKQLIKASSYHKIAQKQCKINIANEINKHVPIKDLSDLISTFCGFDANPEYWIEQE